MSDGSPDSEAEGPLCTSCVEPTVELNGLKIIRDVSDGGPILLKRSCSLLLTALDWLLTNTITLVVSRVLAWSRYHILSKLRHLITRKLLDGMQGCSVRPLPLLLHKHVDSL